MSRSISCTLFVFVSVLASASPSFAGLTSASMGDPSKPDLLYNENTGRVFIDTTELPGNEITTYSLKSSTNSFLGANHTPIWGAGIELSTSSQIGDAGPFGPVSGLMDLGLILPSGLDMAGLNAAINPFNGGVSRKATGTLGTGVQELEFFIVQYDPFAPDLYYNPATGEVSIDASEMPGEVITAYSLNSTGGDFIGANHNPIWGQGLEASISSQIGDANPFGSPAVGVSNLGAVLPTGLDMAGLTAAITSTTVTGELGAGTFEFEFFITCGIGDADCNGYVDLDDLIPAVGNFTGPCMEGVDCFGDPGNGASIFNKVRAQGDVNNGDPVIGIPSLQSDGDIDLDDIITMVGAFTGPPADSAGLVAASGGDLDLPDLIYNTLTGEVTLNVDDIGGTLQVYNIKAAGGGMLTTPTYTPILGGGAATDLTTEIGEFAFASVGIAPGGESIGNIFPTGMDLAALTAFVTGGTASPGFGGGTFSWELFVVGDVDPEVPEPSTYALAMFGLLGLGLFARRRRQS